MKITIEFTDKDLGNPETQVEVVYILSNKEETKGGVYKLSDLYPCLIANKKFLDAKESYIKELDKFKLEF